ncbi:MAG: helix-turn-helix domain-containing protein [Candidatus Margulisbacteria bacterium]|jgi:transcriptional regulator with XRE-family HTH domain|nr:helix-turn-helix domain-containing protein [Candidatus Margulisiibacteriota bacterium]
MEQSSEISLRVGRRIARLRKRQGLTLEKLAYENDIPKSTLSRIERGLVDARISNLARIAAGLAVPLRKLF